jgi:hypothetical protein
MSGFVLFLSNVDFIEILANFNKFYTFFNSSLHLPYLIYSIWSEIVEHLGLFWIFHILKEN